MPSCPGFYERGLVCTNGHCVNSRADGSPQRNAVFCSDCGAPAIDTYPACKAPIRGRYVGMVLSTLDVPSFCHACGAAYPWTEARLQEARELIALEENTDDADKAAAEAAITDVMHDTPRTRVAVTRLPMFRAKAKPQVASALRDFLVDVASETAKKILFPA